MHVMTLHATLMKAFVSASVLDIYVIIKNWSIG